MTESGIPPLCAGDRLTRDEFERRYAAMPHCKKAELVEGVVYMPSPVSNARHGKPHSRIMVWLGNYVARTPGVDFGDNATVRLDLDNEPQPDAHLRLARSGHTRMDGGGYLEGPPELVVEVAASSASYDLHDKLHAYRRNGILEYVVHRVDDGEVDWFALRGGAYERLAADAQGVLHSAAFPGLGLDVPALLRDDLPALLATLERGLATGGHRAFVAALRAR